MITKMLSLRVTLNGTDKNPWHEYHLTANPFPQIAKAEYGPALRNLAKLDGDPIPHDQAEEYIRGILKGWDEKFVDLCVAKFKPGERVQFEVEFPE